MVSETINNVVKITYLDEKILHIKFVKGSSVDLKESDEIIELSSKLSKNETHANLVDTSEMLFMSRLARANFAKQDKSSVVAIGVVINSKLQTLLANMYLSINKPLINTKMFDNFDDTKNWLISQLREKNII